MFADFKISLVAVRANAGMTLDEFAKAVGVSKDSIFNWEHGKGEPTATALRKMSEISGIPMDYIFVPEKS